jgi:hypothetical protein
MACCGCAAASHAEKLVTFSCKRRGFARAARRMRESAALLVDEVLPPVPIRQWVLSVPFALRYLFARDPKAMSAALLILYRTRRRAAGAAGRFDYVPHCARVSARAQSLPWRRAARSGAGRR